MLFGVLLSTALLLWIGARLDWSEFWNTLHSVQPGFLMLGAVGVCVSMGLRTLRWTWLAGRPARDFHLFWRAFALGYLGNLIYPARAGEILRAVALAQFAQVPLPQAAASVILDRFTDVLIAGVLMAVVLTVHGQGTYARVPGLGPFLPYALASMLVVGVMGLVAAAHWQPALQRWVTNWRGKHFILRGLQSALSQGLDLLAQLAHGTAIARILAMATAAALMDCAIAWVLLHGTGWDLEFMAGITVYVFVALGISLPSAPGYVGVFQAACIVALALHNIPQSQAVAYSLVLQGVVLGTVALQGGWVAMQYGIRLLCLPTAQPQADDAGKNKAK